MRFNQNCVVISNFSPSDSNATVEFNLEHCNCTRTLSRREIDSLNGSDQRVSNPIKTKGNTYFVFIKVSET